MRQRMPDGGFTYLGLVILVAVIGMVGAATLKVGSLLQRAAAEEELLDIGAAFSDALRSYAAATPPGQPQQPPTLQALLRDPRFPNTRRHLRKIFIDPMTGKAEWGLMTMGDRIGVVGVYSLSEARPLKIGNFDARFVNFDGKQHLSEWKFTASGQGTLVPPGAPAVPGQAPLPAAPLRPVEPPPMPPPEPPAPEAAPAPAPETTPEPVEPPAEKDGEDKEEPAVIPPPVEPKPALPPMPPPGRRRGDAK